MVRHFELVIHDENEKNAIPTVVRFESQDMAKAIKQAKESRSHVVNKIGAKLYQVDRAEIHYVNF